jgi:hypothetical protein
MVNRLRYPAQPKQSRNFETKQQCWTINRSGRASSCTKPACVVQISDRPSATIRTSDIGLFTDVVCCLPCYVCAGEQCSCHNLCVLCSGPSCICCTPPRTVGRTYVSLESCTWTHYGCMRICSCGRRCSLGAVYMLESELRRRITRTIIVTGSQIYGVHARVTCACRIEERSEVNGKQGSAAHQCCK